MKKIFTAIALLFSLTVFAQGVPRLDGAIFFGKASDPSDTREGYFYYNSNNEDFVFRTATQWLRLREAFFYSEEALSADQALVADDFSTGNKIFSNETANDYTLTLDQAVLDALEVGSRVQVSQRSTGVIKMNLPGTDYDSKTIDNQSEVAIYKTLSGNIRLLGAWESEDFDTEAPTVPGSLQATAIGETTIDISWAASTDNIAVSYYEVRVDGGSPTNVGGVNSYQITGLSTGVQYSIDVRAVDDSGNASAYSTAITPTTSSGSITAPAGEFYTYSDAAALPPNEAEGTCNGCNNTAGGTVTVSSQATTDNGWAYVQRLVAADGDWDRARLTVGGLTSGNSYTITLHYKMAVGTNGGFESKNLSTTISPSFNDENLSSTTWTTVQHTFTLTGGTEAYFDVHAADRDGGSAGDTIDFKISIVEN